MAASRRCETTTGALGRRGDVRPSGCASRSGRGRRRAVGHAAGQGRPRHRPQTRHAATAREFSDPSFDKLTRALNTEIANDATPAAEYREKLARPLDEAKKKRLRSAQEAGRLGPQADLDLSLDSSTPRSSSGGSTAAVR
ncbi:TetR-like C-terminal domain-containing protein [Streptomyces sp. RM72]|uniref:TetR-like C-terminal domain-containing protein n=1 Tax=Streptomyces sp. RM72 TaxID=1115510 RepID=UPI0035A90594